MAAFRGFKKYYRFEDFINGGRGILFLALSVAATMLLAVLTPIDEFLIELFSGGVAVGATIGSLFVMAPVSVVLTYALLLIPGCLLGAATMYALWFLFLRK